MARRVCFALDLIADADLIADYERAHAAGAVWPDVTDAIRAKGFEAMEIWRTGDRLFMIAEVAEDWPRAIPPIWRRPMPDGKPRWIASKSPFPMPRRARNGWR